MDDGASLDELKRRAYSSDDADAVDARERLAAIERLAVLERETAQTAAEPPSVELPNFTKTPRWVVAIFGLVAAAAVATGTIAALTPQNSLDIFSRAQNAQDLTIPPAIGASAGTERWLGDFDGYGVFAFFTPSGEICIVAVRSPEISGSCVSRVAFLQRGLELQTTRFTSLGTEYFTVQWGPHGHARFTSGVEEP